MIILNPRNLPESLVRAVTGDPEKVPNPLRFGVNELIAPPMVRHLRHGNWGDISEEVENMTWMMLGSAFHAWMEKYAPDNAVAEEKIEINLQEHFPNMSRPYVLSGIPDCYYGNILDDYKVTSVWSYIYGDKPDWVAQLNIYRWMVYVKHNIELTNLRIIAVFKDWSEMKTKDNADYPPAQLMIIPIETWSYDRTKEFINERVLAHDFITPCNDAEKYHKPDTYAVMKSGRKSALRVLATEEEAQKWMESNSGDSIVHRVGEDTRCRKYCSVRAFCPDNPYKNEGATDEEI